MLTQRMKIDQLLDRHAAVCVSMCQTSNPAVPFVGTLWPKHYAGHNCQLGHTSVEKRSQALAAPAMVEWLPPSAAAGAGCICSATHASALPFSSWAHPMPTGLALQEHSDGSTYVGRLQAHGPDLATWLSSSALESSPLQNLVVPAGRSTVGWVPPGSQLC